MTLEEKAFTGFLVGTILTYLFLVGFICIRDFMLVNQPFRKFYTLHNTEAARLRRMSGFVEPSAGETRIYIEKDGSGWYEGGGVSNAQVRAIKDGAPLVKGVVIYRIERPD